MSGVLVLENGKFITESIKISDKKILIKKVPKVNNFGHSHALSTLLYKIIIFVSVFIHSLNLQMPIQNACLTARNTHLLVPLRDGKLIVVGSKIKKN